MTISASSAAKALSSAAQMQKPRQSKLSSPLNPFKKQYSSHVPSSSLVSVSTLPNGVRVATDGTPGHFSSLGIYIDTGSRFERPWIQGESGVSHLIDRMAFKSTSQRSSDEMIRDMEKAGGNIMCSSSRETIMYQAATYGHSVSDVLSILSDTVLNPRLTEEELLEQKEAAAWEINEIWNKPEMIIPEMLHSVAYNNATLGNPLLCPMESLQVMTSENLQNFRQAWFTPERIVVAGAGVEHQALLERVESLFGHLTGNSSADSASASASSSSSGRSSSSRSNSISSLLSSVSSASTASSVAQIYPTQAEVAQAQALYTGGELYEERGDMDFTHLYVAFEGLSIRDDDIYALATLQMLLGGGGSFSAGGPGKGMYSRLYSNVLNQHHAVDFCAAFHHCYADSGLFGIAASVDPSFNRHIPGIIANELNLVCSPGVTGSIKAQELQRAKNQLKSSLVMALESRVVQVEDVGRQVQVHGRRVSVEEMCEKIDEVDLEQLTRVARRVLRPENASVNVLGSGQSSVVAMGNLNGMGDVRTMLRNRGLGL
ncbi:LuxS/MPP-like metallohydrolase [Meira miltonrushii]|uniref:Alpha-MPP n=1 Tax=Meira miltonrushii TaxID=1280837 RepID=A0A316VHT8_9BASI|nr:LuxS/MPP-like metallohydrolase [Meira miltonrushii]PWN35551.1 LuxS/MPP-like metallohydrolase [Meira miltonrushii]